MPSATGNRRQCHALFHRGPGATGGKAGATFISPFVGRLDDIGQDGMGLIEEIVTIYDQYGFDTEVLVASVRSTQHVVDAATMGADVVTLPLKIWGRSTSIR